MEVHSSFEIPASSDEAWGLLLDVPRVIPCMPGAVLVEELGGDAWKAQLTTRLGPVRLSFDADVERVEVDTAGRSVKLTATARERSGRGGAQATIVNRLEQDGERTVAHVDTDLVLTGTVARFGRQSLVQDVAAQITDQFAANLQRELRGEPAEAAAANGAAASAPVAASGAGSARPAAAATAAAPAEANEPSAPRMIAGIALRSVIRRLERLLTRVEHGGAR